MANKRIIELQERTSIDMGDWLIVDSSTSTRKLSLATLFNYMTYSSMIFVTELPTTDISTTTIYLVPHSGSTTDWDEYIYRENEWVLIGTSTIDLSAIYQTKTDNNLQTTSKQIVGAINEVNSALYDVIPWTITQTGGSGSATFDEATFFKISDKVYGFSFHGHVTTQGSVNFELPINIAYKSSGGGYGLDYWYTTGNNTNGMVIGTAGSSGSIMASGIVIAN